MKKEMKKQPSNMILYVLAICLLIFLIFAIMPKETVFDGHGVAEPPGTNGGDEPGPGNGGPVAGNGNGGPSVEEPGIVEPELFVPAEIVPAIICGDGKCSSGETYGNCPVDCCATEGMTVSIPQHCCEGLKAVSPCYPRTPCLAYGWVCVNCGDKFCRRPENSFNCPEDCGPICGNEICEKDENYLNCPLDCVPQCGNAICEIPIENYMNCNQDCCAPAGSAVMPPYNCCPGLDLVEYHPPEMKGGVPISVRYCVDCGNHLCEEYETVKNCPEDCDVEINCDDLPKISAQASYDEIEKAVKLEWKYPKGIVVKSQTLSMAYKCKTEDDKTECDWLMPVDIDKNLREWIESLSIDAAKLKFYKINSVVELGCKPICLFEGTRSEGWYDSCSGELIKYDICKGTYAECKYQGTRSEGWYKISMLTVEELIAYDFCSKKIVECSIESDIFLKFSQKLYTPPKIIEAGPKTSINWLINIYGSVESTVMMNKAAADYVTRWDCSQQRFMGTARGTRLRGIYTGVFQMQQGYPYSVSATIHEKKLTWATKLPEHLTFNLCPGANYISLPLDTRLEKASEICDDPELGMKDTNRIGIWDAEKQEIIAQTCEEIKYYGFDFDLEPGQVYYITIPNPAIWNQK